MARLAPAAQQAEDACSTMEACLEALRGRADASAPRPTKAQLAGACQLLRTEVAKLGLLYGSGSEPSPESREALLRGLQNAVSAACLLLLGAAGGGAGPTLRHALQSAAERAVAACVELVRGAVAGGVRGDSLMHLVGLCMERCDALARVPLDNRTAIGRAITQVLKTLADASRELQEIAAEAEAAGSASGDEGAEQPAGAANGGAGAGGEGGAGSDEEDAELACEALTPDQTLVVRGVHSMLGAVSGLLKAVARALLGAGAALEAHGEGGCGGVDEWEGLLFHVRALATSAEDLAAAIYPPQDIDELEGALEAVVNGCELISEETPVEQAEQGEGGSPGPVRELAAALGRVEEAHAQLSALLSRMREDGE